MTNVCVHVGNFRPWGMGDHPGELIALNLSQQPQNTNEIVTPKIVKVSLLLLVDMKGTTIVLNWHPEVSLSTSQHDLFLIC